MLRRTIRLRDGEYEIVTEKVAAGRAPRTESGGVLRPVIFANLLHSTASDALVARTLRLSLADYLGVARLEHRTDSDVIHEFARLLATDRIALRRIEPRSVPVALPLEDSEVESEDTAPPPPPPKEEVTWIEIVLVDEDDQPVAREKCELKAPDGSRLGPFMTDFEGRVRVDGIEPGEYEVRFIELDEEAWEAA